MTKKWPILKTDEEAERFVEEADLSEYDFGEMVSIEALRRKIDRSLADPRPSVDADEVFDRLEAKYAKMAEERGE